MSGLCPGSSGQIWRCLRTNGVILLRNYRTQLKLCLSQTFLFRWLRRWKNAVKGEFLFLFLSMEFML
uniref:Uncharacterized protein n=1 Tax=Physcomitrium patens TaxID=3218 RepID=A0A2K1IEF4_PHYPA|nr:hypothetical protein PHYPA_029806 [Physcomitrium patens]